VDYFENSKSALIEHLRTHAVRTDGPFVLRSGKTSDWYIDARQTTFSGEGARIVGRAVLGEVPETVVSVGGMTMGADPIAVATAIAAADAGRALLSFSIRKEPKDHGVGGRLVGPIGSGDRVVALEDTTSTGAALAEAIQVLREEGVNVEKAVSIVDRSDGATARRMQELGVPYVALVTPSDLGVGSV
jgi:orotate phosphoribosyltransferase